MLRVDAHTDDPASIDADGNARSNSLADKVRERLCKTDTENWDELLVDLIAEVRAGKHTPATGLPGGKPQAASALRQAADEDWSRETLARAASRGRVGSSKAAAQILAGSVPVPPGPEATAAASRLFIT